MQNRDEDKYMERSDEFSRRIRQKLENHRMPVENDCWDAIEKQVIMPASNSGGNNRRIIMRWIGSVAAVAAVITLVFLIIPDNKPLSEMASGHQEANFTFSEKDTDKKLADVVSLEPQTEKAVAARVVQYGHDIPAQSDKTSDTDNNDNDINNQNTDIEAVPLDQVDKNNTLSDKDTDKDSGTKKDSEPAQQRKESKRNYEPRTLLPPSKKGKNDKWLLAAAFSSGSSSATASETLSTLKDYAVSPDDAQSAPALKDPGVANSAIIADDEFTDADHDLPLSFGLSVRKDINKYFGIETGLTYTYLSSEFERVNIPKYKSKRELHYLGIPVNLVVYLWNDPKWNVYVSGGVMLEKGLRQKKTQDMYQNDVKVSSTSDKGSISGVQWSLNAAAGASYAFYNDLSLYVEPRFSHYFDNDQPISIRTEKSNVFSLAGGLRYKF